MKRVGREEKRREENRKKKKEEGGGREEEEMDLPSHLDRLPSAALQQQAARSDLKIIKYINI